MNSEEKKSAEEMALRYSNNIMREPQIHWVKDMREANEKYKSLWIKLCGRLKGVMVDAVLEELGKTLAGSPSCNQEEQDKEDSVDEEDKAYVRHSDTEQGRAEELARWFEELKKTLAGSPSCNQEEQDKEDSVDEEDKAYVRPCDTAQGRAEEMAWWFEECFPDEPIQEALWEAIPDGRGLECRLMVRHKEGLLPFNVEILPGHLILWPKKKKKKGVRKCQPK